MDSIHFHIHGDMNINVTFPDDVSTLAELIDNADENSEDYQKLVDSLEEYLHDAADEAETPEHDVDSIVMVMRPGSIPEVMQETDCWEEIESKGLYDCLEIVNDNDLDVEGLMIVFDERRVLHLGKERYLLGPVIVYKADDEGDSISLSAEDVIAAVVYFTDHTVTLCADGKDFPAFHI